MTRGYRSRASLIVLLGFLRGGDVDVWYGDKHAMRDVSLGIGNKDPDPFPKSIYDNVAYGPRIHGLAADQQQCLCIARTIAVSPGVILMDEPCSAPDPIATARAEDCINGRIG